MRHVCFIDADEIDLTLQNDRAVADRARPFRAFGSTRLASRLFPDNIRAPRFCPRSLE